MHKQAKPKKPGRPRMAKGQAKGTIEPVRFSPGDRKRVETAAKASEQTASAWIRARCSPRLGTEAADPKLGHRRTSW